MKAFFHCHLKEVKSVDKEKIIELAKELGIDVEENVEDGGFFVPDGEGYRKIDVEEVLSDILR